MIRQATTQCTIMNIKEHKYKNTAVRVSSLVKRALCRLKHTNPKNFPQAKLP